MSVLHGFRPALPVSAIRWTNRYAQRVILIVAGQAEPQFRHCDHGRSSVLGRRPFRGPLRVPAVTAAHRHYTELRRYRHCNGVQMLNVGTTGAREASPLVRARRRLHDLEQPLHGRPRRRRTRHPRRRVTDGRPGQPRTAAA